MPSGFHVNLNLNIKIIDYRFLWGDKNQSFCGKGLHTSKPRLTEKVVNVLSIGYNF